jgi:hypothetical protein
MEARNNCGASFEALGFAAAPPAAQSFQPDVLPESLTVSASKDNDFYMIIFSAQRAWNLPKYTHTFATFVKTSNQGTSEPWLFETHTISWLAARKKVRLFRFWPEPGANLDLTTSLEWAISVQSRISMWGPYQIRNAFYEKAMVQKARLESGTVQYKVFDPGYRPAIASSCIHGVCDIDQERGMLWTWLRYGESASKHIAVFFLPWMIDPQQTHPWVSDRLGLSSYPIILRELPARCLQRKMEKSLERSLAVQGFTS